MTEGLVLAPGAAADVESLMPVMDSAFDPAFGEAWTRGQCLGILSLPDVWLTLARLADGHVCGFTLARRAEDEAELLLLAVEPVSRGQGIGRELVERCAADARSRRATKLILEMREGNSAGRLYEHSGFTVVGRRKAYYRGRDGRLHDALTMRRSLRSVAEDASFAASELLQQPKSQAS
ncbi:ribosomal-protein-alanine N-acetyltransferase [Sphingomonas vulcanisoli]|uniref:Ribosomal-protein-alanine N-acetyltransferase n=1 Tax=Sphingomonas vulcanisoli TaxID=1658060 RepID=A0ABX0TYS6_9SPHN|nr:GNAT family N-acetyltransferase [Sphingomonas vulcanisoli]NIJ08786.1 ribosomal-protein-alanine N-acetyltransferase [Sphingomonas vulcanisoli]